MKTKSFVEDGFITPEAKQRLTWVDQDTVLIGTDWGEGSLTDSGYPMIIKRWKRGTPLSSATELLRGQQSDVGVWPMVIEFDNGQVVEGAVEADTFFTSSYWHFDPDGTATQWPVPPKSEIAGLYQDWMLLTLQEDWTPKGQNQTFLSGDLVAFDYRVFGKQEPSQKSH